MKSSFSGLVCVVGAIGLCTPLWGCAARDRGPSPRPERFAVSLGGRDGADRGRVAQSARIGTNAPHQRRRRRRRRAAARGARASVRRRSSSRRRNAKRWGWKWSRSRTCCCSTVRRPIRTGGFRPITRTVLSASGRVGGASYGVTSFEQRFAIDWFRTGRLQPYGLPRVGAGVGRTRGQTGFAGERRESGVGENLAREGRPRGTPVSRTDCYAAWQPRAKTNKPPLFSENIPQNPGELSARFGTNLSLIPLSSWR